jgi:Cof subfamily protein (haloacid dehalogenase superfamily)
MNQILSLPYELVVIDVDGTLLDSQHQLSSGAKEAVAALQEQGILPMVASGRPRVGILPLLDQLGLGQAHIGAGGAYACDRDGTVLFQRTVPNDLAAPLIQQARQEHLEVAWHMIDQILLEGSDAHDAIMRLYNGSSVKRVEDVLKTGARDPLKITLWGQKAMLEPYRIAVEAQDLPVDLVYSTDQFLEINGKGIHKGRALALVAGRMGIPLERVAVIGDQFNDVSMFQEAGFAIAMGNAPEEVKRAAGKVAPSNDEGGFAWAMYHYILKPA